MVSCHKECHAEISVWFMEPSQCLFLVLGVMFATICSYACDEQNHFPRFFQDFAVFEFSPLPMVFLGVDFLVYHTWHLLRDF